MKHFSYYKDFSASNRFANGELRFILDLEQEGFVKVITEFLKRHYNLKILDEFDGFSFLVDDIEIEGHLTYLYWDEDLGIFFVAGKQTEAENTWLEQFLKEMIPSLYDFIDKYVTIEPEKE